MVMKHNSTLKSRAYTGGCQQQLWTNKEDLSLPTPSNEALKFTLIVDAQEKHNVARVDLPVQFLQTEMNEVIHLKVNGPLALLLVEHDTTSLKKHLRKENICPAIYVLCNNAFFCTLNAAVLAYKNLTKYFIEYGFKMNPYKPCVWNTNIDGNQFIIIFRVIDLKLSHVDPSVVTMIINKLQNVSIGNSALKDELIIT